MKKASSVSPRAEEIGTERIEPEGLGEASYRVITLSSVRSHGKAEAVAWRVRLWNDGFHFGIHPPLTAMKNKVEWDGMGGREVK